VSQLGQVARDPLDEVETIERPSEGSLVVEVRRVDHERVFFPSPS